MYNVEKLEQFLKSVCEDFRVIQHQNINEEAFSAKVQCKLQPCECRLAECRIFMQKFSLFSSTNWIVQSRPLAKRLEYRKLYICQHASLHKSNKKREGEDSEKLRNMKCCASVDFKIKKINKNTIKNDKLLKIGLNVIINFNFQHTHRIKVASAYSLLRCDHETKKTFTQYFEQGMTPSVAKQYHELNMIELEGTESVINLANAQINPTMRQIRYIYDLWRQSNFGTRDESNVLSVLKQKADILLTKGCNLLIKENPTIVIIITPIMKRFFLNGSGDEMIYVDSSGSCDQTSTQVTFIFTSHKIGAAPLACILHTDETEANFTASFLAAKEALEAGTKKTFSPLVIMTDDCSAERNALRCVFPNSTLLLCTFHICQAMWRWLWQTGNKVVKHNRQDVMKAFQNILYAENEEQAEHYYKIIMCSAAVASNISLQSYIKKLWHRRQEWCIALRGNILTRGNNTNNYMEASIRVFKDVVLQRSKVFNSCALVEFISGKFESYHKLRLLEFANTRRSNALQYTKFLKKSAIIEEFYQISENEYRVKSAQNDNAFYSVLLDIACCDCSAGKSGKYCKHLCALEKKLNITFKTSPHITMRDRIEFAKIALGDDVPEHFYAGLAIENTDNMSISNQQSEACLQEPQSCTFQSDGINSFQQDEEIGPQIIKMNDDGSHQRHNEYVSELRNEFMRICDIFQQNFSPSNTLTVARLVKTLNKTKSISQVSFIPSVFNFIYMDFILTFR